MQDFSKITDSIFSLLQQQLIPKVMNHLQAMERDLEITSPQKEDAKNIREQYLKTVYQLATECLCSGLIALIPQAGIWISNNPKPTEQWQWIISPFVSEIMGRTCTSIALAENDQLYIGLYIDYENMEVASGVYGEGAYYDNQIFSCHENRLNANSSVMNFTIGNFTTEAMNFIKLLQEKTGCQPMYNHHATNINAYLLSVAQGEADLVIASGFQYLDVAASICIAQQANAVVTDWSGNTDKLLTGEELICCNKKMWQQIQEL